MKRNQNRDLYAELITSLNDGTPHQVCIGLHWTAAVMEVGGEIRCGLASTQTGEHPHGQPNVPQAGKLEMMGGFELATLVKSDLPALVSVGMAAINALLPRDPQAWVDLNAEQVIASHGRNKSVVLVGHFPFVDRLRQEVGQLSVLELNPRPGDLPASSAGEVIPEAEVVALTGNTLLNHTFAGLLSLCKPEALVILLGPSVPLSPVLFDHGVDILSGSVVTDVDPVLAAVREGANFRQVHRAGVRLVTIKH